MDLSSSRPLRWCVRAALCGWLGWMIGCGSVSHSPSDGTGGKGVDASVEHPATDGGGGSAATGGAGGGGGQSSQGGKGGSGGSGGTAGVGGSAGATGTGGSGGAGTGGSSGAGGRSSGGAGGQSGGAGGLGTSSFLVRQGTFGALSGSPRPVGAARMSRVRISPFSRSCNKTSSLCFSGGLTP